jgi:hypothetical protein
MRAFYDSGPWVYLLTMALLSGASQAGAASPEKLERRCHAAVGRAGATCLGRYTDEVRRCRDAADAACEEALRVPDGPLAQIVADVEAPIRRACTDASAERLSLTLGVDRHVQYVAEGCRKWGSSSSRWRTLWISGRCRRRGSPASTTWRSGSGACGTRSS